MSTTFDCDAHLLNLCRSKSLDTDQEHLKCSTYAKDKEECSAHFIRTAVLRQILLSEIKRSIFDKFDFSGNSSTTDKKTINLSPKIHH